MVAPGYMPAEAKSGSLPFSVALCSVGGLSLTQPAGLDEGQAPGQEHLYETCPFGLAVAYKLFPGAGELAPMLDVSFRPFVAANGSQPAPALAASGPPLGSRAPPFGSIPSSFA